MSAILTSYTVWLLMQEIRNSSKFYRVGPLHYWHYAFRPLRRIGRFLPASWTVQWSSVEVTSYLPWWWVTSHTLIILHAYCPGS